MTKTPLSSRIQEGLNTHLINKTQQFWIYSFYALWARGQRNNGIADFFSWQAQFANSGVLRLSEYIRRKGTELKDASVILSYQKPSSLSGCFGNIVENELKNKESFDNLHQICHEEGDWETLEFIRGFEKDSTLLQLELMENDGMRN